ncbi:MAG: metal-sulfur cluster assembly factor [bacterium]|nr:metal-sulfur cluster assembly factor [bacterium]
MITEEDLIEVFKNYDDPELNIDVWTLGLIYKIEIIDDTHVKILLTFTSPMCPFGPEMVAELKKRIQAKGVENVEIEITFDPPWEASEELREMLGV